MKEECIIKQSQYWQKACRTCCEFRSETAWRSKMSTCLQVCLRNRMKSRIGSISPNTLRFSLFSGWTMDHSSTQLQCTALHLQNFEKGSIPAGQMVWTTINATCFPKSQAEPYLSGSSSVCLQCKTQHDSLVRQAHGSFGTIYSENKSVETTHSKPFEKLFGEACFEVRRADQSLRKTFGS